MESVIKQLVKIGHGMGAEVANDEPAVAKLLVELSSALDVQYERANALEAKCAALAAENAELKHAMAVTLEHVSVTDTGQAGVAAMIINDALHHSGTPATDAFLAEVRAQAIMNALESLDGVFDTDCVMEANGISYEDAEQRTAGALAVNKALANVAFELRKGASA